MMVDLPTDRTTIESNLAKAAQRKRIVESIIQNWYVSTI
jgi:hypothetical protein